MTNHFIKLTCGNCGGELEIYDDMDQFACGHCGAGIAVQRRGGTVVLNSVPQAINKTPASTGQALKEEASNLSKQYDAMLNQRTERIKHGYILGISLLVIGFVAVRSGYSLVIGLCLLLAGIVTISSIRRNGKKVLSDARELHAKIDVLNGRIADRAFNSNPR
jgi:ribosomal protein S27E